MRGIPLSMSTADVVSSRRIAASPSEINSDNDASGDGVLKTSRRSIIILAGATLRVYHSATD